MLYSTEFIRNIGHHWGLNWETVYLDNANPWGWETEKGILSDEVLGLDMSASQYWEGLMGS